MIDETPPMPASEEEWEVHWAFYRITVQQRDMAWRENERLRGLLADADLHALLGPIESIRDE